MKIKLTFIAITAFAFSTSSAFAQPPQDGPPGGHGGPGGPGGNPIMDALDPDHNHEISAQEIANASKALKALDKNGDGVLNEEDLGRMGPPQGGGPPEGGRGGPGGGPGGRGPGGGDDADQGQRVNDFASRLMAFDKNDNGKVEKDELPTRMQRVMASLDKNGDDVLEASELESMKSASNQRSAGGNRGRDGATGRQGRRGGGGRGEEGGNGRRGARGGQGGPGSAAAGRGGGAERMIEHAFEFDKDGDGKLSREELAEFAKSMPQPGSGPGMGGPGGRGGPGGMRGGQGSQGGRGGRPGGR